MVLFSLVGNVMVDQQVLFIRAIVWKQLLHWSYKSTQLGLNDARRCVYIKIDYSRFPRANVSAVENLKAVLMWRSVDSLRSWQWFQNNRSYMLGQTSFNTTNSTSNQRFPSVKYNLYRNLWINTSFQFNLINGFWHNV